jgi:hypothetical protein
MKPITQSTHTPGPWEYEKSSIQTPYVCEIMAKFEGHGDKQMVVARSYSWREYGVEARQKRQEEAEANARLIASAPELLDACKKVVEIAESHIHSEYDGTSMLNDLLKDLEPIKKVIAKAEGTL